MVVVGVRGGSIGVWRASRMHWDKGESKEPPSEGEDG